MTALKPQNAAAKENSRKHKPPSRREHFPIDLKGPKISLIFWRFTKNVIGGWSLKAFRKKHPALNRAFCASEKRASKAQLDREKFSFKRCSGGCVFPRRWRPFFVAHFQVIIRKYEKYRLSLEILSIKSQVHYKKNNKTRTNSVDNANFPSWNSKVYRRGFAA